MRLAAVVGVKKAGRALELVDNDPLGAVDDKHAIVGHQRQSTEEHLLLFNVAHRLNPGGLVVLESDQANGDFHRCLVGHAALNALLHRVFRHAKGIIGELKRAEAIEIIDGKYAFEYGLQTDVFSLSRINVHLQKAVIRMPLHGDEMRRLYNFACFGKPFAYSRHDPLVMQSAEKSALI